MQILSPSSSRVWALCKAHGPTPHLGRSVHCGSALGHKLCMVWGASSSSSSSWASAASSLFGLWLTVLYLSISGGQVGGWSQVLHGALHSPCWCCRCWRSVCYCFPNSWKRSALFIQGACHYNIEHKDTHTHTEREKEKAREKKRDGERKVMPSIVFGWRMRLRQLLRPAFSCLSHDSVMPWAETWTNMSKKEPAKKSNTKSRTEILQLLRENKNETSS